MTYLWYYATPLGKMGVAEQDGKLTNLFFEGMVRPKAFEYRETSVLAKTAEEIQEYFAGYRHEFTISWTVKGTLWEQKVWDALCRISYGETCSYGGLARVLGMPKASRAVGRANSRNPIAIIIPCHRVIGAKGAITGYSGGIERKRALLELEKVGSLKGK